MKITNYTFVGSAALASLFAAGHLNAQLVTGGSSSAAFTGYTAGVANTSPNVVITPGDPVDTITFGTAITNTSTVSRFNSAGLSSWIAQNTVKFTSTSFGPQAPSGSFKVGTITYKNGTTTAGTNLASFDLAFNVTLTTSNPAVTPVFSNIPIQFDTVSVGDVTNSAPPANVTVGPNTYPYAGVIASNTPLVATNQYGTGSAIWNNPDGLYVRLPTMPLTYNYTDLINNFAANYTFTGFGFGAGVSQIFWVDEGTETSVDLYANYTLETFAPIPEPSTYGMMGAGLLVGFAVYRRKAAKKKLAA